ncbi:MAG: isopenicillin-N epimerase [Kiritimatiellia bacterium]|jgi:isopenicillin-N epimerase
MQHGRTIRHLFALKPDMDFLNHGSFGATPLSVLDRRHELMLQMEAQPCRFMFETLQPELSRAAQTVQTWLGSQTGDLVFVDNATTAINAVLRGLDLRDTDRVLTLSHVYNAVRNTAQYVCVRSGAELIEVAVPFPLATEDQVIDALVEALKPGAAVAILDHITSPTGLVLPIERMVQACRDAGVPVLVDAAHSPGHVAIDLDNLGADWVTGNLHKWAFAPKGTAFLWIAPGRRPDALVISHLYQGSRTEAFHWPGTRDFSGWLAAPEGVTFHTEHGGTALMDRNRALCRTAADLIADRWAVDIPSPASCRAALCTLPLPTHVPPDIDACIALSVALWSKHRIEVPIVPFGDRAWVRFSVQIYNELDQYERLAHAVIDELTP